MKRWSEIAGVGRNEKPHVLYDNWDEIIPTDKPKALVDAWAGAEWPLRQLDMYTWIDLFDEVTGGWGEMYIHETHDPATPDSYEYVTELKTMDTLPETITLYRGAVESMAFGMSWTDDRDQADWFAHRFEQLFGAPIIIEVELPRRNVLARIQGARRENEYVVNIDEALAQLGTEPFKINLV